MGPGSCFPVDVQPEEKRLKGWFRLTPASQVLQSDDSRGRNLTFVILQGERPRHLQQRPFNGDGPLTVQS